MTATPYPVRLEGRLDTPLSRWLWLVKWLLVLPHAVVLAVLWVAAVLLTVVAAVAILFTGRYPRFVFAFNVGVLRWTWRVAFYTTAAFGTDRYPPFGLSPDPAYPADLDVDYPERLSRGLVLVKWLLAVPHYLVVAAFAGGLFVGVDTGQWRAGAWGLVSLLAVVAMVMVLFGRAYPRQLFDFVMGMNRWCARVAAYVLLLRDEYPPLRLDAGPREPAPTPGGGTGAPPAATRAA